MRKTFSSFFMLVLSEVKGESLCFKQNADNFLYNKIVWSYVAAFNIYIYLISVDLKTDTNSIQIYEIQNFKFKYLYSFKNIFLVSTYNLSSLN